jgi:predicted ATPase/class 3 adenylate cyclase/Tfp pilus assembly protein PilF
MVPITRPTGTVTFLFTDIEGSTRLWERHGQLMKAAHERQEAIVRQAIQARGGYAYKMIGDAFQAAFPTATQALEAALEAQRALYLEHWGEIGAVRVRMALHTGVAEERGDDYVGPVLNRAARLMSAAHGGQVLISQATQQLLRDNLPAGVTLRDMGEHRLRDLTQPEHIFQLVVEDIPADFPSLKTLEGHPNNLPVQTTPLVGRDEEVSAVRARLLRSEVRLLTLTGVGGIGKTRLALQAAAEMLYDFPEGVFFVNLAPLVDPGLVVPTVAYTLGLREAGAQPIAETLKEYLKDKKLLLVLDNFEQVLKAAPGIADLLRSASQLRVLATSRAALGLSMEHQYAVPPLQVPDPRKPASLEALSQYGAVTLFIQRAEASKPDFQVNNANAPAVAEICYRLEGIPLAIELAAARIKVLTPRAILERLGNRLKLLTGGATDLPSRQQTLRSTIEWSYDLLSEGEKQLFRRLAVFRGGRTLEAAEAVCNSSGDLELDVLDGITSLVDKSLMYVVESASSTSGEGGEGGEPRYVLLETIHEYAWEKLLECGDAEELQRQHALYFMGLAEQAEPELTANKSEVWLARLELEHDNIRAALSWSLETGIFSEFALRIAGAIWRFWYMSGYLSDGRTWLGTALARSEGAAAPVRAKGFVGYGVLLLHLGEYKAAELHLRESLRLYEALDDKAGLAAVFNSLGTIARDLGDSDVALERYGQSLSMRREINDKWGIAQALNNLSSVHVDRGEYEQARIQLEESYAIFRELGDKWRVSYLLMNLGNVVYHLGDYERAKALLEESLALCVELGDEWGRSYVLLNLGGVALDNGEYERAEDLYRESLVLLQKVGEKKGISENLEGFAEATAKLGKIARAARLWGAAAALRETIGIPLTPDEQPRHDRGVAHARAQVGDLVWGELSKEGQAMNIAQAISYALEQDRDEQ